MRQLARAGRLAVVLALCLATASVALGAASAEVDATTQLYKAYFPWAPNGDTVNGVGPWSSELTFQNLSGAPCQVAFYVGDPTNGTWPNKALVSVSAGAVRSIGVTNLAVPTPGAPVRLESPCPITAALKVTTPKVVNAPWSDGASGVTGYTALAQPDLDASRVSATSAWFLPIAQTNSDWNTFIRVTNLSSVSDEDVTVELYPADNASGADGAALTLTTHLAVAQTWTLDTLGALAQPGWVGYAKVTANHEIGVVALRSKPTAQLLLTNVAIAADAGVTGVTYVSGAALLFNAYNGWNTGINLANVSDVSAHVTVEYYPTGEGLLRSDTLTLAPRSMQYIYTPGNVEESGFVGNATIVSDAPVVAAVDEVKYETTEGLSYIAGSVPQTDGAIPLTFREDPANGLHDNSGVNIANLDRAADQTVAVQLYSDTGAPLLTTPFELTLPAGGDNYVYLPFLEDLAPGTVAAARITTSDPAGFTAISNDVNYAVAGDGSLVLSAAGMLGYYHLVPVAPPS